MSSATLLQLVDKTSDWDKDERYMATNDLCNLLSKDVRVEEHVQQKVCAAILKQLGEGWDVYVYMYVYAYVYGFIIHVLPPLPFQTTHLMTCRAWQSSA
ncbi:hypothetical protein EON63_13055 [archaeon]|nr:MAG: hypothetical protein EON63_13055 [archaeon]